MGGETAVSTALRVLIFSRVKRTPISAQRVTTGETPHGKYIGLNFYSFQLSSCSIYSIIASSFYVSIQQDRKLSANIFATSVLLLFFICTAVIGKLVAFKSPLLSYLKSARFI